MRVFNPSPPPGPSHWQRLNALAQDLFMLPETAPADQLEDLLNNYKIMYFDIMSEVLDSHPYQNGWHILYHANSKDYKSVRHAVEQSLAFLP